MSTPVAVQSLPGSLPRDCIPTDVDLAPLSATLPAILASLDATKVTADFIWRDTLALTGAIRTHNGAANAVQAWLRQSARASLTSLQAQGEPRQNRFIPGSSWVSVDFSFESRLVPALPAKGTGTALFVWQDEQWKLWVLATVLNHFVGLGSPLVPAPVKDPLDPATNTFSVVIVGGGLSGLTIAGRLNAVHVDNVVLDAASHVGASWSEQKYDSIKMHSVRDMNTLPFERTFAADEPLWLPGENVANGQKRYVEKYNIRIRLNSTVTSCVQDPKSGLWTMTVDTAEGQSIYLAKHVVFATGICYSKPYAPVIAGQDAFQGQVIHVAQFRNAQSVQGRRAVVIGAATAAHDVACDLADAGIEVTMIQRNPTTILPRDWLEPGQSAVYNPSIPTEVSDAGLMLPWKIFREVASASFVSLREQNPERLDALERVGFRVERSNTLFDLILSRGCGYYIDDGGSARVVNGEIKVRSGVPIESFTPAGLRLADGSELQADTVVFATGFEQSCAASLDHILEHEVTSKFGVFQKLGPDAELGGVGVPMAPRLWCLAAGPIFTRWYSKFVALQIQADLLGHKIAADA